MAPPYIPVEVRFANYLDKTSSPLGCWLWTGTIQPKNGYGYLWVNRKSVRAHRLSYELHKGPIPNGMVVMHTCDVRHCVNPSHLLIGTFHENAIDCANKGRTLRERRNPKNKLSEAEARSIIDDPRVYKAIAKEHGISVQLVYQIKKRKAWKWLDAA